MSVLWNLGFSRFVRHCFRVPSWTVYKADQKHTIDYSRVPNIIEEELEEQFVCGFGPGGQAVNKTASCIVLKHLPTGLVVKCQQTRSQFENRKMARLLLQNKLDELYNGELSVSSQQKQILAKKSQAKARKSKLRHEMKKTFKDRENIT